MAQPEWSIQHLVDEIGSVRRWAATPRSSYGVGTCMQLQPSRPRHARTIARSTAWGTHLLSELTSSAVREQEFFERQAWLGTTLSSNRFLRVEWCELDGMGPPQLVQTTAGQQKLSDWLGACSQTPSLSDLLGLGTQLVASLQELHTAGYQHGQLRLENLTIEPKAGLLRLDGLYRCLPIGSIGESGPRRNRYEAPEQKCARWEASAAVDIYQLAGLLAEIVGSWFLHSNLARSMMSRMPEERPSASELLPLLVDLRERLIHKPPLAA